MPFDQNTQQSTQQSTQQCTTQIGQKGEELVCKKLVQNNFRIIERNVQTKVGEIDIVADDQGTLCFVEVRTRENTLLGHPSETITEAKMKSVRRSAEAYMAKHKLWDVAVRFDVATFIWDTMEFEYFPNSF